MRAVPLLRCHWGGALASVVLVGSMVALLVTDRVHGTLRDGLTPWTIGWSLVAAAGFAVAVWANERRPLPPWLFWSVPVVARLLLLATEPTLSDDVYRYLWDGHVITEGISPYSYAIADPALDPIAIPLRELTNNQGLASPYLPTAQAMFALVALVLPASATSMQAVMVALDLATAGLLHRLLGRAGLPAGRSLLYLWNPLVIIELAHGAHLDALMVFLTVAALSVSLPSTPDPARAPAMAAAAAIDRRRIGSGVLLALAALTRPIPVLVGPAVARRLGVQGVVAAAATVAALLVPFGLGAAGWGLTGDDGTGLFGSARAYSRTFSFNGFLNGVLDPGSTTSTVVIASMMAAVLAVVWWRAGALAPDDVLGHLRLAAVPVMAYVLGTPVLHPWYLVLLVALVPFLTPTPEENGRRWWLVAPWAYLTTAVPLSYLTYLDPQRFAELRWVQLVEWVPTLTLLVGGGILVATRESPPEGTP